MTIFNYFEVVKLIILSLEMSILVTKEFRIFKFGLSSMVMDDRIGHVVWRDGAIRFQSWSGSFPCQLAVMALLILSSI